jgi:3-methyl-2-oxobutanoate hydroxymethyltransferase
LKNITIRQLQHYKQQQEKIACLTAYDASFARLLAQAELDIVLVGDSLGMTMQGAANTLSVTIQQMVYHTRCVVTGLRQHADFKPFIISDLPFLSAIDAKTACLHSGRLLKAGAEMVKIEANANKAMIIKKMIEEGIPVCGHLGLRPQQSIRLGGFRRFGRKQGEEKQFWEDAEAFIIAGCQLLLVEAVPGTWAQALTARSPVPVIGIGSGRHCDGQILVLQDILGMSIKPPPFAKNFLQGSLLETFRSYRDAVKQQLFPH